MVSWRIISSVFHAWRLSEYLSFAALAQRVACLFLDRSDAASTTPDSGETAVVCPTPSDRICPAAFSRRRDCKWEAPSWIAAEVTTLLLCMSPAQESVEVQLMTARLGQRATLIT